MATFIDPRDALLAALHMLERVDEFNATQGDELVRLKVGIHWGACLAVTLNDRLDYFGQTVNLAARVQSLAHANEIVISHDVAVQPSVGELIQELEDASSIVQVKGIESDVAIHRLTSPKGATRLRSPG